MTAPAEDDQDEKEEKKQQCETATTAAPLDGPAPPGALSKSAQKRLRNKLLKKRRKEEHLAALRREFVRGDDDDDDDTNNDDTSSSPSPSSLSTTTTKQLNRSSGGGGGKASRARRARNGDADVGSASSHRPSGGAPVVLDDLFDEDHRRVIVALEEMETRERTKHRPHLTERKEVPTDNHGSMEAPRRQGGDEKEKDHPGECDMSERSLRSFALSDLPAPRFYPNELASLTVLDLSRNELWTLPDDLTALPNLEILDLSRNWFRDLPSSVRHLTKLRALRASHNMLRPTPESLQFEALHELNTSLREFDIAFNRKCGHRRLSDLIKTELPFLDVLKITICYPRPDGAFVGDSAADRDPTLLRSQLEPWSTTALRRRIVSDFGGEVLEPEVGRGDVMKRLLELYAEEGLGGEEEGTGTRTTVRVRGEPIDPKLGRELLDELQSWSGSWSEGNQERTTIKARNYMILSSPAEIASLQNLKRAGKAAAKLERHRKLWDLAQRALEGVDPDFGAACTAVAVTHGFTGSPHIDRQNVGPFYGLALGDFEDGTGEVVVECSARILAKVDTKGRLGRVDGRFPHWVAPYDAERERYSLIYYQTAGDARPVGAAVFEVPTSTE